jgi:hypothetical protein
LAIDAKGEAMSSSAVRRFQAGALMIVAGVLAPSAVAQQAAPEPKPVARDYYQRSLETYEFRKAAQSGPERGREIFYYKCWFCHNEFTKHAPQLTGLYKYTLSEADLNDLVSFVREKCCWDSDAPPLNPRYQAR